MSNTKRLGTSKVLLRFVNQKSHICILIVMLLCVPHVTQGQSSLSLSSIKIFSQIGDLIESNPEKAFTIGDTLLKAEPSSELRLAMARYAVIAGDYKRAISYAEPAENSFILTDPAATEILDILADAHKALMRDKNALRYSLRAYNTAKVRLGHESPALLSRLDTLEPQLAKFSPGLLSELREQRKEIKQAQKTAQKTVRAEGDPHAVTIWYGTNRNKSKSSDPASAYGYDIAPLSTGKMIVTIPPNHLSGLIEQPSGWGFTSHWDPKRHVVLAYLKEMARKAFAEGCCAAEDRLLFIHGYNTSFHDGALRAAQLSFDLEFKGDMLYYSWPSKASLFGYLADANKVIPTRRALTEFLEIATRGSGRLHIIAHSMGNRYALSGLENFAKEYPDRRIGHLILAAPDVSRIALKEYFPTVAAQASSVTLYASSDDIALKISKRVNGSPRAGDANDAPLLLDGLDTIDASDVTADLLGHSYVGDAPQILADILGLIGLGQSPDLRCGVLPSPTHKGGTYWRVQESGCRIDQLRVAFAISRMYSNTALEIGMQKLEKAGGDEQEFWEAVVDLLRGIVPKIAPKS